MKEHDKTLLILARKGRHTLKVKESLTFITAQENDFAFYQFNYQIERGRKKNSFDLPVPHIFLFKKVVTLKRRLGGEGGRWGRVGGFFWFI